MPLADDIRAGGARARAELVAAHDYYSYSESLWDRVRQEAATDPTVARHNPITGTTTAGPDLAALADWYTKRHLPEMTLQHFLSVFEVFVADLLRLWLTAFPKSIASKVLTVGELLEAGDVPTLLSQKIDHELAEVTYKSPRKVFEYVEKRTGVPVPAAADLDRLAEAKATRDVLVHTSGVVDAGYLTKAGALARAVVGERIEIPKPYHRGVWELVLRLTDDLATAAAAKVP